MRILSVAHADPAIASAQTAVDLDGTTVSLAIAQMAQPDFDHRRFANSDHVLVRIDAFSCNYRDKSLIVETASKSSTSEWSVPNHFGSEFAGTVVACGASVMRWKVGDRVMPDADYPGSGVPGVASGIVTNCASSGWVRVPERRLASIPACMTTDVAASFSLGAQTAASMVRRAEIKPGERVIVTSARSNTSLFLITALNRLGAKVVGLSTGAWSKAERQFVAPCRITNVSSLADEYRDSSKTKFDVVLDPFYDLNLAQSVRLLRMGGRYVTCGMQNQHKLFRDSAELGKSEFSAAMYEVIVQNLTLIGNCIGTSGDLQVALDEYDPNFPRVPVDSIFSPDEGMEFMNRTFNSRERFGKVIMYYSLGLM